MVYSFRKPLANKSFQEKHLETLCRIGQILFIVPRFDFENYRVVETSNIFKCVIIFSIVAQLLMYTCSFYFTVWIANAYTWKYMQLLKYFLNYSTIFATICIFPQQKKLWQEFLVGFNKNFERMPIINDTSQFSKTWQLLKVFKILQINKMFLPSHLIILLLITAVVIRMFKDFTSGSFDIIIKTHYLSKM